MLLGALLNPYLVAPGVLRLLLKDLLLQEPGKLLKLLKILSLLLQEPGKLLKLLKILSLRTCKYPVRPVSLDTDQLLVHVMCRDTRG